MVEISQIPDSNRRLPFLFPFILQTLKGHGGGDTWTTLGNQE